MNFDNLTEEQEVKALACKTSQEMLELAKEEGYELSGEELEVVSGGVKWSSSRNSNECPMTNCGNLCLVRWRTAATYV